MPVYIPHIESRPLHPSHPTRLATSVTPGHIPHAQSHPLHPSHSITPVTLVTPYLGRYIGYTLSLPSHPVIVGHVRYTRPRPLHPLHLVTAVASVTPEHGGYKGHANHVITFVTSVTPNRVCYTASRRLHPRLHSIAPATLVASRPFHPVHPSHAFVSVFTQIHAVTPKHIRHRQFTPRLSQ